jgi:glycogen operon protein
LIRLKREHPVFHRPHFFQGRSLRGSGVKDIYWLDPSGRDMTDDVRNAPSVQCIGVRLAGDAISEVDKRGERLAGDTMLLLLNKSGDAVPFTLPELKADERWELVFDTAQSAPEQTSCRGGEAYPLHARSMAGWRLQKCEAADAPAQ